MSKNRLILETVALGLGDLIDQFVFVGGTVVEFYATSQTYSEVRETDDVDCVVEVSKKISYNLPINGTKKALNMLNFMLFQTKQTSKFSQYLIL
jgi:hypothetical protein